MIFKDNESLKSFFFTFYVKNLMYKIKIKNSFDEQKNSVKSFNKVEKKKKLKFLLLVPIFFIVLLGIFFFKITKEGKCLGVNCGNVILGQIANNIQSVVNNIPEPTPKLVEEDGKTNILIFGVDTRETNSGLMNTDTMIIVSIDHKTKVATMISIPRDLWVKFKLPNGNTSSFKVNGVYASGEIVKKGKGVETLQNALTDVTGLKIHYYVKVTLKAFVQIIDTINGIDVDIPNDFTEAYPKNELPSDLQKSCNPLRSDKGYCLFFFKKGVEHMDGQRALIYARSRQLSQHGDFDRARRQQQVINSVKNKILSTETLLDPLKLWELYGIVKDNIETSEFTINDIRAALELRKEINTEKYGSVILDPYFGNVINKYIYRPTDPQFYSRGYFIAPRDVTFKQVQAVLSEILKNPFIYNEAPIISIYNATGTNKLEVDYAKELIEQNPFFIIKSSNKIIKDPNNVYDKVQIYRFCNESKVETEKILKDYFQESEILNVIPSGLKNYSGEDYVIVIGKSKQQDQQNINQ